MATRLEIITTEELSAFIDGELDLETRVAVETAAGEDPRVAELIDDLRREKGRLRRLLGGAGTTPPIRLARPAIRAVPVSHQPIENHTDKHEENDDATSHDHHRTGLRLAALAGHSRSGRR